MPPSRLISFLPLVLAALRSCVGVCEATPLADRIVHRGVAINDPAMTTWCASPIRDDAGGYHLFVSRWPSELKVNPGWRSHSEIAHFSAPAPTGPYQFRQVALAGTAVTGSWEQFAPHNPLIKKMSDLYALIYIARQAPDRGDTQAIGIATSGSLDGPWIRKPVPILTPSIDPSNWTFQSKCGVTNPALLQMPDGRHFLYFKAIKAGEKFTRMGLAIADKLEGPYEIQKEPVTSNDETIEDGFAFISADGKVHLVTTDNHGILEKGGGLEWVSADGRTFEKPTSAFHALDRYVSRADFPNARFIYGPGEWKIERPQLLLEKGVPRWLFGPSGISLDGDAATESHVFEILPE